jgi:D-cysteine desulfhydrase family pyridoxal phosphate-dependent enzyme
MIGLEERLTYLQEKLAAFSKASLAILPTPCQRLASLSRECGVEIFCKRDDMTGFGFGGNKTRKLEFLLEEARGHGCEVLVTSGGTQSNFCRMVAAAGAVAGMSVHLVLGGGRPSRPAGNLLLDQLLGAKIHYVNSPDWNRWESESEKVAEGLRSQGKKVFRLPIGGSVPMGALGYVSAFTEILKDERELGVSFDLILHASGSGGTQAGLLAGKGLTGWGGAVEGISVAMEKSELEEKVFNLALETSVLLGGRVERDWVLVDDRFIGSGYAVPTPEGERAIAEFAKKEGIFLDRVYTGKAASALFNWVGQGRVRSKCVLFLHTGGQPELFA